MPRVKFDYIVSFSSEDPEHPASNLLSWEVSKKKWLCAAGETSASVVLQLDKAVQIGTVAVGAHHAAFVEVLVGRSETPAEPYQVLVASCVFLSPSESRKAEGAGVERVRSFTGDRAEGVWAQRWDRVRVLLSQPYNKHCKFGVSFVHVFSPDMVPSQPLKDLDGPTTDRVPARPSLLSALNGPSSDEEEFRPGELFAQHKLQTDTNTSDTGSQIRRASSHLLRAASAAGTATLVKTPRPRPRHAPAPGTPRDAHDRVTERNETTMDTGPDRPDDRNKRRRETDDTSPSSSATRERDTERKRRKHSSDERDRAREGRGQSRSRTRETRDVSPGRERDKSNDKLNTSKHKPHRVPPHAVLAGVVCVLSGYENPRRAALRNAALALGARVNRDWDADCTHLICAFPKTPKLRAVRSAAGGARVPAVLADWVEECARLRRRLPEEWFSTEAARRVPVPEGGLDGEGVESEDTDDDIERVLRGRRDTSPPPTACDGDDDDVDKSTDSDVAFVADDRIQGSVSVSDDSRDGYGDTTDVETAPSDGDEVAIDVGRTLPPLLRDMVFVSVGKHVDRYVRAYGGTILPPEEVEGDDGGAGAVYALCESAGARAVAGGVRRLHLRWLWRAHRDRCLPSLATYILD